MNILIYSCVFGKYEIPQKLNYRSRNSRHVMFTDNKDLKVSGWETIYIEPKECPKKQSREIKINIHKFIDASIYVYLDPNYKITNDLFTFVKQYFKNGYTTIEHPTRKCIYDEANRVIELKKEDEPIVDSQINKYRSEGMPNRAGLYMNGFFIRDKSFNDICEQWYDEVELHSYRDQLSLPYVLWKNNKKITSYNRNVMRRYLLLQPHLKPIDNINIWHFVPGAGDKNLGRELNKHCEIVPNDEDWIVIRDNDTCYLHPFINKQLEDIIKKHGNDYQIFSCLTNRLGLKYQLPYGLMNETDVLKLRDLAEKHYAEHYDEIIPCRRNEPTAGLFAMFQKKTWKKHKYDEGLANAGGFIDWRFTKGHLDKGSNIAICKGIFLFHYYRMHQDNWREYNHLK